MLSENKSGIATKNQYCKLYVLLLAGNPVFPKLNTFSGNGKNNQIGPFKMAPLFWAYDIMGKKINLL